MKKTTGLIASAFACAVLATTALSGCGDERFGQTGWGFGQNSNGNVTPIESPELESEALVSPEEARQIALDHAGISEDEATIVHEGRDTEYGALVLEVEFYDGVREYDYSIDADTGEIIQFDEDAEHYAISDMHLETPPSTDNEAFIGEDAAIDAALYDADLQEGDVTNMRVALDYDERVERYEVEFDTEERSYEYEINAETGEVMSFDTNLLQ